MTTDLENKNEQGDSKGISRRRFLQILGGASAVGAVGCTDRATQTIFPNLKADPETMPGVAAWYSSTCTECAAGCGIQVRTREGRAVKIEGNKDNPVNKGGLCALGQSALQSHYDPDRVRQPLKRVTNEKGETVLQPISWAQAITEVNAALAAAPKKKALVTGEVSGSIGTLLKEWSGALGVEHFVYDVTSPGAVAKASELVFGSSGVPTYSFEKADFVLNFGADFLETWVSPCEYARGWAKSRRRHESPLKFVHIEPRLSLTGANADLWLSAKPGSEVRIALALLKDLLASGRNLPGDAEQSLKAALATASYDDAAQASGVPMQKILLVAEFLKSAKHPLVISGGASAASSGALSLAVVANCINVAVGAVGDTVVPARSRTVGSSPAKLMSLFDAVTSGNVSVLMVYGTNPRFTLPPSLGFTPETFKKVKTVISFASHLDETTANADLVLPSHSSLESWGDARPYPGVYSIIQPAMTPIFDTKAFGDSLLEIAKTAGKPVGGGAESYQAFVKAEWKKLHGSLNIAGDFDSFWVRAVERGGYFVEANDKSRSVSISSQIAGLKYSAPAGADELTLLPFFSVKSFDGRAANRPWLQELPDPITSIVWDAWAEIHPTTAESKGIKQGDFVTVRNYFGEINVPAYLTEHIKPNVIAVPVGQGHEQYGRYARKVGGGNVLGLVRKANADEISAQGDIVPLLTPGVTILRGKGPSGVVVTQGSDLQGKREIARVGFFGAEAGHGSATAHAAAKDTHGHSASGHSASGHGASGHGASGHSANGDDGHAADGGHGGHHEAKQMYNQREHPLYRWALGVDLSSCTGCSACVVACYAENNIPVVGKKLMSQGREMSWIRIERYMDGVESEELQVSFIPMMCQHCNNAPCEPVCPVYATYHNDEGLNAMIYNRCVGTRYCSNNCSYKVRRFNWFEIEVPEPLTWQLNPDVSKRVTGIMEKCTFCIQRINEGKDHAKDLGHPVRDGDISPACVQSCPSEALVFGNLNDAESRVAKLFKEDRAYKVLDHHINTQPSVSYLERMKHRI